jgi:hypothetical protein
MTEQAISPLRRRMIEDMSIRKFAAKTQHDYVQRVKTWPSSLAALPTQPRGPKDRYAMLSPVYQVFRADKTPDTTADLNSVLTATSRRHRATTCSHSTRSSSRLDCRRLPFGLRLG